MRDGLGWVVRESLCKRTGKLGKRIFQAEGTAAVKILSQEMTLKDYFIDCRMHFFTFFYLQNQDTSFTETLPVGQALFFFTSQIRCSSQCHK